MNVILGQLGGLLLGSVPTIIFLVLLLVIYTYVVDKPLSKVLAERHSRTEGAIEKAKADIAQAEARTAEYEQRMREALSAPGRTEGVRVIADRLGVSVGTVQRISRPFEGVSAGQ